MKIIKSQMVNTIFIEKMNEKKILFLGINPFSANRGVGALAYSMFFLLEKVSKETNQSFKYYLQKKPEYPKSRPKPV